MNKVRLGFFSFTEITDPNEHRSYNEWHQLDHMPEQFPLPGIAWGQRWVSTPACRDARAVSGTRLDPVHYVTLYLMTDPVDETLRAFRALGRDLRERNRFHLHRHAHLSGPFSFAASAVASRVFVSAEAVPYRPNRGVYVVVQPAGASRVDIAEWCTIAGVAGAWSFADDERRISVAWCDEPPLAVAPALALPREGDVEFAGPFETITPWEWDWFER